MGSEFGLGLEGTGLGMEWNRKEMELEWNGIGMERNGAGMEWNGMRMELEWNMNRNGMGLE